MALPAAAADNCNVPDFTLTASIIGPVSTKDQALDCAHRQLALAHFGKVAQLQAADANEARSGMWTSNGDAMAREAADLAVKNSVIKAQIDVFAAALGVIGKADSKSAADVTQVTLKFTAAMTSYITNQVCSRGRCSPTGRDISNLVASLLKTAGSATECVGVRERVKCVATVKGALKNYNEFAAIAKRPLVDQEYVGAAEFVADWLDGAVSLWGGLTARDKGAMVAAAGTLADAAAKTYAGYYTRKEGDLPSGFQNLVGIMGEGTSTWLTCKGAMISLQTPGTATTPGTAAGDCLSKLNDYFNTRIAEIMSYTMVLAQAVKEQYEASVIDGSRAVMGEVFKYGGWAAVFKKYGLTYAEGTIFSGSKDLNIALAIERIGAAAGVKPSGLTSIPSNWWDGWHGDVLRRTTSVYFPMVQAETKLLVDGTKSYKSYVGIKFDAVQPPTVALTANNQRSWDAVSSTGLGARSTGPAKGVDLQIVNARAQLLSSLKMAPSVNFADGSTQWTADLSTNAAWKALPDAAYSIRAVVTALDGSQVQSSDAPLTIARVVTPPPKTAPTGTIQSALNQTVQVNSAIALAGTAKGTGKLQVSIIYTDFNSTDKVTPNAQGAWDYTRVFPVDGSFNYRVELSDDSGLASTVLGRGVVQVTPLKVNPPPVPVVPTYASFSVDRLDVQAGESVTITVKMSAPVDSVRVVIDQLSGGTTLALTNPSGNKLDWVKTNQPLTQPGSAANQYKRPLWAIATVAAKGDLAATAPINLTVRPTPADGMDFVTDTYKDDTVVPAGSQFTKTWTLRNTGTKPWTTAYCMVPVGGETALGSGKSCATTSVAPNGQTNFSVVMRAPAAANADKTYIQHWQLLNAAGTQVGTLKPWARIIVKGTAAHIVQHSMPEMVMQGSTLGLAVQTDKAAQAVTLELASPSATYPLQGSGTSWTLSPVAMGVAGNRAYTIKVTTAGELTDSKTGSLFIRGSGTGGGVPLAQITNVSANPPDVMVGQAVQFTVQTDSKVKSVAILFDSTTGTPTTMGNPSGNGVDWVFNNFAGTVGQVGSGYARSFWVTGTRADGSAIAAKGPYQVVVRPSAVGPVVNTVSPTGGTAGQKVRVVVNGKSLPAALKVQITGAQCTASLAGDLTRREYDCTLGSVAGTVPLTVFGLQDVVLTTRRFDVAAAASGGASSPIIPPVPLTPQLTKVDTVQAGLPWSAKLTTNVPVDSADLVFANGRRIPFDGGPLAWTTRDENTRFSDAGSWPYELQIRRTASAALEKFAGGTLTVTPQPVTPVAPTVTSALQAEQGKPYNLTVTTDKPADRVMVRWPDSAGEQGLRALDAQRTQWEFGARLFMQAQPVAFTVSVYKDGATAAIGSTAKTLAVSAPAGGLRLVSTSNAILQGESPYFTLAASLSIAKVTVQLGGNAPVTLASLGGSGAEQSFRGQVRASLAGPSVPWQAVGYNAQGQEMARVAGTVAIAAPGDALRAASPVPAAGIAQGDAVEWQFLTVQAPAEMWMEFASPIGNVPLVGAYFRRVFNEAPGKYNYRLMRRDHLGNVFAIQGASGVLTINPRTAAAPVISQLSLNGRAVGAGGKVSLSLKENLLAAAQAAGAKGLVLKVSIPPSVGDVYFKLNGSNGVQWQSAALPGSLGDYFRGQVKPGIYAAQVYLGSGGTDLATNLGGVVSFNLELTP